MVSDVFVLFGLVCGLGDIAPSLLEGAIEASHYGGTILTGSTIEDS